MSTDLVEQMSTVPERRREADTINRRGTFPLSVSTHAVDHRHRYDSGDGSPDRSAPEDADGIPVDLVEQTSILVVELSNG